ncbi:MAG: DUF4339 domain-containing protein [Parachlamydiaceae bacterium]|nr:DUF4339 domain-containing protein [Parachlamydiaceae bacterium]
MREVTDKIWVILIEGHSEGPFSLLQLRYDTRITPDTLAKRQNGEEWRPIREIPELAILFADDEPLEEIGPGKAGKVIPGKEGMVLSAQYDYPPMLIWLFILLIVALYVFYQFNQPQ